VDGMHRIVRKGAHFTEYAVLGALVMLELSEIFLSHTSTARRRLYLVMMAASFGLFYAILDEVHQIFSHRGASPRDVCIDFAGVIFGVGLVAGLSYIIRRIRGKNHAAHRYGKGENA